MPNWSPDGKKIVFDRGPAGASDVYLMNADCSNQVNLTNNGGQINEDAAFSPDGTKIVFETHRNGIYEIYTMDTNGQNQKQMQPVAQGINADWQPLVESRTKSLQVIFYDEDSEPLKCTATNLPEGLVFDPATGVITGSVSYKAGRPAPYIVVISCTDGVAITETRFDWTIIDVNRPPVVGAIPDQKFKEGDKVALQVSATDPDGDSLTCSLKSPLPDGLSLDPATCFISGLLSFKSATPVGQPLQTTITVSDGVNKVDTLCKWEVINVNRPPVILNPGPQKNYEGDVLAPPAVIVPPGTIVPPSPPFVVLPVGPSANLAQPTAIVAAANQAAAPVTEPLNAMPAKAPVATAESRF
jgi:hypothetical protein